MTMSNLANPETLIEFTYETIAGDKRVPIKARVMTDLQEAEYDRLEEELRKDLAAPNALELRDKMLALGIISPSVDELKSTLSRGDMYQIAFGYMGAVSEAVLAMLGKSRSRRLFTTASPAGDAAVPLASTSPASDATPPATPAP